MKTRREISTQYAGVFRVQKLDDNGRWVEPKWGAKFLARRYVLNRDGKQKEEKRHFETILEAKAFRNGTPIEKEVANLNPKSSNRKTFEELVRDWERDWLPNKEIATQIRYKSYLQHFKFFWSMAVDEIEPIQIDKWIAHIKTPDYLKAQHSTRCGYDHEFTVLRSILNYYSSRFNRNYRLPFIKDHNKMLKVKNKPLIKKDLQVDQLKAFVQALRKICWNTKWEAIYYLALMQYAIYGRVQEAAALSYEDFDFVNNKLTVNKKVVWARAKDYEDQVLPGAKTETGGKVLDPIPNLAVQVFRQWVMRSGIRSGGLFRMNGQIITYRQIESRYTQALKMAGLAFSATHILRHAALTEAYQSCKDLLQVQQLAGQTDYKSTTRYAKVRDEQIAETQRKMDQKLISIFS